MAATTCLRSVAGFGFPLFAGQMYDALGYGKGNTVLAAIAIGIGCPAYGSYLISARRKRINYLSRRPWLFWFYGEKIRGHSKHAA